MEMISSCVKMTPLFLILLFCCLQLICFWVIRSKHLTMLTLAVVFSWNAAFCLLVLPGLQCFLWSSGVSTNVICTPRLCRQSWAFIRELDGGLPPWLLMNPQGIFCLSFVTIFQLFFPLFIYFLFIYFGEHCDLVVVFCLFVFLELFSPLLSDFVF